ncbi:MAG: hypothetical protein R2792_15810 [Saprospiraceae bacterium]
MTTKKRGLRRRQPQNFFYKRIGSRKKYPTINLPIARISDGKEKMKNILQQTVRQIVNEERFNLSSAIHTDISYLNLVQDDRISFIGINNEPFALSTDPKTLLEA